LLLQLGKCVSCQAYHQNGTVTTSLQACVVKLSV
jgi:hypothetical protein